ncbi:uncharacterized protein [Diadema setosum]|uniref:uncharacterized protein n=1 Tax=Diadema setosum TaxID=31175 RepID=UPI003B3AA83D
MDFSSKATCLVLLVTIMTNALVSAVFSDLLAEEVQRTQKEPVPDYLRSVVDCHLGRPHRRFPECRCGEYAVVVPKSEIPHENLNEYHVMTVTRHRTVKLRYYFCNFCSMCPDGIATKKNCSQVQDTQCSSHCSNPRHIFDMGRKACIDRNAGSATSSRPATAERNGASMIANGMSPTERIHGRPSKEPAVAQTVFQLETLIIILAAVLIVAMVIVIVINLVVCFKIRSRESAEEDREKLSQSQSSSQASITQV